MLFRPHFGKWAPTDAVVVPVPLPVETAPVGVSPRRALLDAWAIFCRNPLLAAGSMVPILVMWGLDVLGGEQAPVVAVLFAAPIGWPLCVGLMACAVDSANAGEPRVDRLLVGFHHYGTSLVWGLVATVLLASGALIIPIMLIWPCVWLVTAALAERQQGIPDAAGIGWAAYRQSFWPLVATFLLAAAVAITGGFLFGAGLFITIPVAGLMLGCAYRDAGDALGTGTPARPPRSSLPA